MWLLTYQCIVYHLAHRMVHFGDALPAKALTEVREPRVGRTIRRVLSASPTPRAERLAGAVVWLCAVAPDVCTLTGRDRLESLYS